MVTPPDFLLRALSPAPEEDDPLRIKILDAALALAVESGLENLTVDDVAKRAGAGRVTVYRRFGDKRGLINALLGRETRRCLTDLRKSVDVRLRPRDQVVDGFVHALRIGRTHPLMARALRFEKETVLRGVSSGEAFALMCAFMVMQLRAARFDRTVDGGLPVEVKAELVVRLGLSYLLLPDGSIDLDDVEAVRRMATLALLPMIEAGVSSAP